MYPTKRCVHRTRPWFHKCEIWTRTSPKKLSEICRCLLDIRIVRPMHLELRRISNVQRWKLYYRNAHRELDWTRCALFYKHSRKVHQSYSSWRIYHDTLLEMINLIIGLNVKVCLIELSYPQVHLSLVPYKVIIFE